MVSTAPPLCFLLIFFHFLWRSNLTPSVYFLFYGINFYFMHNFNGTRRSLQLHFPLGLRYHASTREVWIFRLKVCVCACVCVVFALMWRGVCWPSEMQRCVVPYGVIQQKIKSPSWDGEPKVKHLKLNPHEKSASCARLHISDVHRVLAAAEQSVICTQQGITWSCWRIQQIIKPPFWQSWEVKKKGK